MPVPNPYRALKEHILAVSLEELTEEKLRAKAATLYLRFEERRFLEDLEEAALAIASLDREYAKCSHIINTIIRK